MMEKMKKILSQIIAATLGLWLATILVTGAKVELLADSNFFGFSLKALWEIFVLLGITLGLLNYFVKPILDTITLPLRIITFGLFSFLINMLLLWVVDSIFRELTIPLFIPLFYTSLIIWGLHVLLSLIFNKK